MGKVVFRRFAQIIHSTRQKLPRMGGKKESYIIGHNYQVGNPKGHFLIGLSLDLGFHNIYVTGFIKHNIERK